MTANVLVVEDAEAIRTAVGIALEQAGCSVRARPDGDALERDLAEFGPDLVLLDVMLPGRDGLALLDVVRHTSSAGIVLLTARDGVADRLLGLRSGADDYVVKPFVLAELVGRVEAVLRRLGRLRTRVEVGDLVVDVDGRQVTRAGRRIELTATELDLLIFLAGRQGRVVGKAQLLAAVWGYDDYAANLVEVHVSALRRKLEAHGPRLLHGPRGRVRTPRGAAVSPLRTVSLRRRVILTALTVLALVLTGTGLVVNAVFDAQAERSLNTLLNGRAQLAQQLARENVALVRRVDADGLRVTLILRNGHQFGAPPTEPSGKARQVRATLTAGQRTRGATLLLSADLAHAVIVSSPRTVHQRIGAIFSRSTGPDETVLR